MERIKKGMLVSFKPGKNIRRDADVKNVKKFWDGTPYYVLEIWAGKNEISSKHSKLKKMI